MKQLLSSSPAGVEQAMMKTACDPEEFGLPIVHGSRPSLDQRPIFYLVDWLPPDFGAVGQYATLFSREMAQAGRQVYLIGLSSRSAGFSHEAFGGGDLYITRLPAKPVRKHALLSRLIWAFSSNIRLVSEVCRHNKSQGADILFTGSPPFMLFFAFVCKWLRSARLIYRITDFYPEVLFAAWGRRPKPFAALEALAWFFRRRVDEFQVLGEDQRRLLLAGGIRPERIVLKRDVSPIRISGTETPAPRPAHLSGRKLLLYSGNYGVAHELDTVVEGLARHHREGSGSFALWLNASGSTLKFLTERLTAERIPFAVSDPVELMRLPSLLSAADCHLICLKPGFSGYVLPSKIYGCLDSGRPILYVGPKSSDIHLLCSTKEALAYEHVEAGDCVGFEKALERLDEPVRLKWLGPSQV